MPSSSPPERTSAIPEARLNPLLRAIDWRFLLRAEDAPRTVDLGTAPAAAGLLGDPAREGEATLVLVRSSRRQHLRRAYAALAPGGEVQLRSLVPAPLLRRRLHASGFTDVRLLWSWPPARLGAPQFWLPADAPRAVDAFLARRPPRSRLQRWARPVWRAAARAGLLFPLTALARRPGGADPAGAGAAWVLLTGGRRSVNKVVGLPFTGHPDDPRTVVKVARTPDAAAGLAREAEVLRRVERELPGVAGVPRVLATGRRAGCPATTQTAVHGEPLIASLTPETFAGLADRVADWLAGLVEDAAPRPRAQWWAASVDGPLERFERDYGPVLDAATRRAIRDRLEALPDLPRAVEHRDCSPWNVLLTPDGRPALLDWESAEADGLPALDLAYYVTMAAFILDGAFETGRTAASHARVLDPRDPVGRIAAATSARYAARLGIPAEALAPLRLLAWVVHTGPEMERLRGDAAGAPAPAALERGMFLGLIRAELAA